MPYHDDSLRQQLRRLYDAVEVAYRHLQRTEELERQAMVLLKKTDVSLHRVRPSPRAHINEADAEMDG